MKQAEVTPALEALIKKAAGDVDISSIAVFEATALNTLPIRKRHPVYSGAVHSPKFLRQMAKQLEQESIPVHLMHDSNTIPSGRVFHGKVVKNADDSYDLRVLYWIDGTKSDLIQMVNNGTIDQVSVSVLAKEVLSNKTGFDFLTSGYENWYTGADDEGNIMGQKGAHAEMNDLDEWFELSLVNRGGARNARIHSGKEKKLSNSDTLADPFVLNLSSGDLFVQPKKDLDMTLEELLGKYTAIVAVDAENKVKVAALEASATKLTADLAAANAEITRLTAAQAAAPQSAAELTEIAKTVLTKMGKPLSDVPTDAAALSAFIVDNLKALKLVAAGSSDANDDAAPKSTRGLANSAFKTKGE